MNTYITEINRDDKSHPVSASILRWTTEKPTEPGYYWANSELGIEIIQLSDEGLFIIGDERPFNYFTHFLGPILEPEPPQ